MAGNENKGTQAERLIQLRRDKGFDRRAASTTDDRGWSKS